MIAHMTTTHTTATIARREVAVKHVLFQGHETIKLDVPNGWDDVRRLSTVLIYEGRRFAYTGWSSDYLEAYFRPNRPVAVA